MELRPQYELDEEFEQFDSELYLPCIDFTLIFDLPSGVTTEDGCFEYIFQRLKSGTLESFTISAPAR